MKRRLRVLALSLLVLAAVIVVAGVLLVDWAKSHLAASGLGNLDFTVAGLALDRLSLSDIRFGSGWEQRLERLTVLFHPTRLLRGRPLDRVLIEGADLRFILGDDSVPRLAGVSLPEASGTEACLEVPAIPVTGFELRTSRLNLQTGTETLRIPLRGTMTQAEVGAWTLDAQLGVRYLDARGELALQAQLASDGALEAKLDLSGAEGWLPGGPDTPKGVQITQGGGRFILEWDGCEQLSGAGSLAALLAGSPVVLEVRAAKAQGEALTFAVDLDASGPDLAALDKLAKLDAGLEGQASLQARLEGALPVHSEQWLEEASASGQISLQIDKATLPDLAAGVSGDVAADLSLSDASLLAVLTSPWKITGRLPGLDPAATFRLSAVTGHGLELTSATDLGRWNAGGAIDFALENPSWPRLAGTASGRVGQAPEDVLRFDLKRLRLDPTRWTRDGMKIHVRALDAQLAGTASRMQGRVSARLDAFDDAIEGRLSGGRVELRGHLTRADDDLLLAVEDCISITAKRLELRAVRWLRPVDVCVRQTAGRPLLRLDPAQKTWSLALTLPSHPVALAVEHEQNPLKLVGTMPQASLSATFDPTAKAPKLRLNTQGGRLELSEQAVAISDLELSLLQDQTASITLKHAVADSLAIPPDFPALTLTGKAKGRLDGTMKFALTAQGREAPLKLSVKGEHDIGLAIGELSYELDRLRFAPQGLQPGALVPAVKDLISRARGSLAMSGGLSWVAGVPATYLHLALNDLGFDAAGLSVRGINTRLERAGRTVRNRLATQEIRVDLLDVGVPLRDGLIRFHTRQAPAVHFEQLRFAWGGGNVQVEPFAIRFDQLEAEHSIVVTFGGIGLDALIELIAIDGLEGAGSLGGKAPLRILGSEVAIDQGSISTEAPGVLRYRPREKPAFFDKNSQTELLFEALQNFHYESLSIGVNGKTQDNLQLSISLMGANPDLYDGHPFKLNFNIGGELDTIVQRSLSIATFAEKFGEFMFRYLR